MAFRHDPTFALCRECAVTIAADLVVLEDRMQASASLERSNDARDASFSDLVVGLADSIRRDPLEWWTDGYKMMHANGVRVWIANGQGYLKVTIPERGDFTLPWWQRRRLWCAVASWRGRPLPDFWRYNPVRLDAGHRS
jgi:hypothetical protein